MKKENNHNSKYRILSITFGILFILTLLLFIAYAIDKKDDFGDGWDASYAYQQAQDYFLGDDDPYTAKITRNDGTQISLSPDTYSIHVGMEDGRNFTLGSVNRILPFSEMANQDIVGLFYLTDYGQSEAAFIDPNKGAFVHLDDKAYNTPDIVDFYRYRLDAEPLDASFEITTDVPKYECSENYLSGDIQQLGGTDYFQGFVDLCDSQKGRIYATTIYVNGEPTHSFAPIELTRLPGGPEGPMGYAPSSWTRLLGVSPALDKAYFAVIGKNFSIDENGLVEEAELPDDMVTIIYE